jgi:hypothetical protein
MTGLADMDVVAPMTAAQRAEFEKNGFLVIPCALSEPEVAFYTDALDQLRARRRAWMVLGSGLAVAVLAATTLAAGMPPAHPRGAPAAAGALHNHAMFAQPLACPKPLWTDEGQRPAGALPISCAMRTLPDGSIERDAVMYADAYGFYGYGIYDQRPDGVTVFIQVANGINHTLPQVDRAQPPGSMAKWEAVVENPAWHLKKGWHLKN